jgi:TRAP transporter TAXI family solute receptor
MEGGSVENIKRLRWQRGVKLAIVQSDVLEFYKAKAEAGSAIAEKMIKPLRVVMPLYNEEVHFLVRSNSNINSFSDLKGKKIALGKPGGGSAITGKGLYKYMFGQSLPKDKAYYTPEGKDTAEYALKALVIDKTVDAWIMVVGQGTKQFKGMKKNANELIKLVKFDDSKDAELKILSGPYFKGTINADSYPWLESDLSTITVKAFLITQKYTNRATQNNIKKFTQSLCKNFKKLQS